MLQLLLILGMNVSAGALPVVEVPLDLIVLKDSAWGPETVYPHVDRAGEIFARCGIRFKPVRLTYADAPNFERRPPQDQELAEKVLAQHAKPALFFFEGAGSEAFGEDFSPAAPRRVLEYTGWIASHINTPDYVAARRPTYDTVAHELAHLLCNCGHTPAGQMSLLSGEAENVNDEVTAEQCEHFRASPLVHRPETPGA